MESEEACDGVRRPGQHQPSWLRSVAESTPVGKYFLRKFDDFSLTTTGPDYEARLTTLENGGGEKRQVTEKQLVHLGEKIVRCFEFHEL